MNRATKAEQYLLDKIRRGDEQAWSEFVERYRGRLFSFAQAKLSHCADAEDAVQDTFVAFVRALRTYRGDCDLETYLFTLIRRKVIDVYRSRQAAHVCLIQDAYQPADSSSTSDPFTEIAGPAQTASWYARADEQNHLHKAALTNALSALVDGLKESLNLRDLQVTELLFYCHLSNKDVAAIMHLSENAVALIKHRSLKQVRKHIAKLKLPIEPSRRGWVEDLLKNVWESQRLSCPKRSTVGAYLLETLDPQWHDYVQFHLDVLGCRFCRANLDDLRAQRTRSQGKQLRARIMESTVGFLTKPT